MANLVITKANGTVVNLPEPSSLNVALQDIDASNSGRNASGYMMRDRLRSGVRKVSCKWSALKQSEMDTILNAITDAQFSLKYPDPMTGASKTISCYCGDRTAPVYWMPTSTNTTWMWSELAVNFIEV